MSTARPPRRACPTCGTPVDPGSDVCVRCGMPAASTRAQVGEAGSLERSAWGQRKGRADLLFLAGLLIGGPIMTVGGRLRLGLFLVLAGGLASVLHRYAARSLGGSLAIGSAAAALIAVLAVSAPEPSETPEPAESARAEYVADLARNYEPDGLVEARGPGLVTVWFFLPDERGEAACGTVPGGEVRSRLRELGFRRVVVSDRTSAGSLCSFDP